MNRKPSTGRDRPRRVVILGATGSVGRNALRVAERHPDRLRVIGMTAARQAEGLRELAARHRVEHLALRDEEAARRAGLAGGAEAVADLAALPEADCVLNAVVGAGGLLASWRAVDSGKHLALANKESLVIGGELLTRRAGQTGATIVPVDSEHNAALQLLAARGDHEISELVLTASGGPFRCTPAAELARVTLEEVLDHPTWKMGPRITVDSATLLNKGFELIEARWLFDLPIEKMRVLVHPQSVVHAMLRLVDGSILASLSQPDMRIPIQLALSWPERWTSPCPDFDLNLLSSLTFEFPDDERFPCLGLAIEVAGRGGTTPAVLNGADEELVGALLERRLGFVELPALLADVVGDHVPEAADTLDAIWRADAWARDQVRARLADRAPRDPTARVAVP